MIEWHMTPFGSSPSEDIAPPLAEHRVIRVPDPANFVAEEAASAIGHPGWIIEELFPARMAPVRRAATTSPAFRPCKFDVAQKLRVRNSFNCPAGFTQFTIPLKYQAGR
jgi:hypothetical protein